MKSKNFTARIVTRAGVVRESFPKKTIGGAERWIKRLIEDDAPSILCQEIHSIKIIHKPSLSFWAGYYSPEKKELRMRQIKY